MLDGVTACFLAQLTNDAHDLGGHVQVRRVKRTGPSTSPTPFSTGRNGLPGREPTASCQYCLELSYSAFPAAEPRREAREMTISLKVVSGRGSSGFPS